MQADISKGNLIPAKRREIICDIARKDGVVRIKDLSEKLKVTQMTVHRDLEILEKQGFLERTHGGAIFSHRTDFEPLYVQKKEKNILQKEEIGKMAASLIKEGDTIFMNSGSSTLSFIRNLSCDGVKIITNNPLVSVETIPNNLEIFLTGGLLRKESFSLVGESALRDIREVYASKAIIGTDGISMKYGLTISVRSEAILNSLMIAQTHGPVIILADSTKFGNVSSFVFSFIKEINDVVTDDGLDDMYIEEFEKAGVNVHLVKINK